MDDSQQAAAKLAFVRFQSWLAPHEERWLRLIEIFTAQIPRTSLSSLDDLLHAPVDACRSLRITSGNSESEITSVLAQATKSASMPVSKIGRLS